MKRNLKNQAVNLEEHFFAKRDAELMKKLNDQLKAKEAIAALKEVSGITDEEVLKELYDLGINATTLAALSMVPLIEVAWADKELDKREKSAILKAISAKHIATDSPSYTLLESWLKEKPEPGFRQAWHEYVQALCKNLTPENKEKFQREIMDSAHKIAESSGGFLGVINKVSTSEEKVLADLNSAFD